jgi:hypothetical protein
MQYLVVPLKTVIPRLFRKPLDSTHFFCFDVEGQILLTIHLVDSEELTTQYDYQHWLSEGRRG